MKGNLEEFTAEELDKNLIESKEELRKLRFRSVTGTIDNPKKIKSLKKQIARILTLKNEFKLGMRPEK